MFLTDKFGRTHNYLRVSLTDRCNLNCLYCNPLVDNSAKMKKSDLLSFDELQRLIRIFLSEFEMKKIRFTGGEPLVRKDVMKFFQSVGRLKSEYNFEFALTTNGTLLKNCLNDLRACGLDKLNISLDSLKPVTYKYITGSDKLQDIIEAIKLSESIGFTGLKINTVVLRGINDDEIIDFVNFIKNMPVTLRFIEYMPFGNNNWSQDRFISAKEIKDKIERCFDLVKTDSNSESVAENYKLSNFTGKIGLISPVSNHFCGNCNRLRIKSDGRLKLCLFSESKNEVDLRQYIRNEDVSDKEIADVISDSLQMKEKEHGSVEDLKKLDDNNMLNTGG